MAIAAMTFAQITTKAMGNGRFSSAQRAEVQAEVVGRYGEVLSLENWTFLNQTGSVTLNAASVALPAGVGQVTGIWLNDDGDHLLPLSIRDFEDAALGVTSPGRPCVYSIVGATIRLSPTPDSSYAATVASRIDPDSVLTGDSDYPILPAWAHPALAAGAAAVMLSLENDATGAPLEQHWQAAIDAMRRRYKSSGTQRRQMARDPLAYR